MRLTTSQYFSDFLVYPFVIGFLSVIGLISAGADGIIRWVSIYLGGIMLWTLIEYGLHRVVFHHAPYFKALHQQHHEEERALLGTPVWLSLLAHASFVFLPVMMIWGMPTATAATAGIMLGYLWYVSIHHLLHHRHITHKSNLYALKRHHALHHHGTDSCNFGVTTRLWDHVFGTSMRGPNRNFEGLRRAPEALALESVRTSQQAQFRENQSLARTDDQFASRRPFTEGTFNDD